MDDVLTTCIQRDTSELGMAPSEALALTLDAGNYLRKLCRLNPLHAVSIPNPCIQVSLQVAKCLRSLNPQELSGAANILPSLSTAVPLDPTTTYCWRGKFVGYEASLAFSATTSCAAAAPAAFLNPPKYTCFPYSGTQMCASYLPKYKHPPHTSLPGSIPHQETSCQPNHTTHLPLFLCLFTPINSPFLCAPPPC